MSQTINGTQRRDGFFWCQEWECACTPPCWFRVNTESLAQTDNPRKCVCHEKSKRSLSSDAFTVICCYGSLSPLPPFSSTLHEKMPFPPPLWLLWYWVTQRLILEIIEIKLFLVFFCYRAVISSAHNLLSCLSMGWLAAVTYTFSFPA